MTISIHTLATPIKHFDLERAGSRLRVIRKFEGDTRKDLSLKTGISTTRLNNLEGLHQKINETDFNAILKAYPYAANYLVKGEMFDFSQDTPYIKQLATVAAAMSKDIREQAAKASEILECEFWQAAISIPELRKAIKELLQKDLDEAIEKAKRGE